MTSGPKNAVVAVVAAAALGALLLGTPGSFAKLSSTSSGSSLVITSGTVTASVAGPTVGSVSIGTAPSGVVVATGSAGIIPGIQDQTLTYTITNSGSSATPAAVTSIRVVSSGILSSTQWTDIQPYLTVKVAVNGGTAITLPSSAITSAGIDATVSSSANIHPGGSVPIVIEFTIPATASSGTIDLLRTLQPDRSGGLTVASIINLTPVFTLTQTPIAAP